MKKSIFLMLLSFVIFTNYTIAQSTQLEENQSTIEAIEKTVSFYIQENIDGKFPSYLLKNTKANSELSDKKNFNSYIRSLKEDFLRNDFFEKNPSLKKPFKPSGSVTVTPCTDTNNDGTFENGNPGTYSATKNGSPISIVTESSSSTPISPVAIVSSGSDPILFSLTTGQQDANAITLSRTNGSSKAVRINQNKRFYTNMTDNHENDKLLKSFVAEDRFITLDYAAVLEKWSQHTTSEHPYFRVSVFVNGSPFATDSEIVRASDNDLDSFDAYLNQNNVNDSYANLTNNLNTDLRYTGQWDSMTLDIGTNNIGQSVEVILEVRDCSQSVHAGYVYVDNISNCGEEDPCPNPCGMIPAFTESISGCTASFNGSNNGDSCPQQTYEWKVNGSTVSTSEDFTYTFPQSGTYNVCFSIRSNDGLQQCIETTCKTITVNCNPPEPCPTSSDIFYLNEGGGGLCTTGQASISGINSSEVDHVNWTWALGGYTGTGAGTGTTTPIYYPSGNWTNYYISICATVVYKSGKTCTKVCKSFLLDCGQGVGNPLGTIDQNLNVFPNPLKPNQELQFDGLELNEVDKVEILDMFGNIKSSLKPKATRVNVGNLKPGIYFIKFYTAKGIEQKKVIIK